MRGMSVAAAALMLFWAATLTGLFIANRHLVTIAQQQVQQASAGKTAAGRTPSCALRVTENAFSTGIPLAARSAVVPRAGLSQNDDLLAALFPRYGRWRNRCCAMRRRIIWKSSSPPSCSCPPDSPLREKMTKTAYGQLKQYLMLTRPEKNGRRVVRHYANAGLAAALRHRRRRLAGQRPFAAGILCRQSGVASAVASACR